LAREIARKIDCYAIINEVYKKPPRRKDPKTGDEKDVPDPQNKRINLNRINQVEKYLKGEFFTPIKDFTDEIVSNWGKALVFWIHGIDDGNINKNSVDGNPKGVHVLVGIGQGSPDRFTAEIGTVDGLIKLFKNNGRKPVVAKLAKSGSRYCGHHENIMNQIFLKLNYDLTKVQSIQLEIMYTGFRDPQNIYLTADAFSAAIGKFVDVGSLVVVKTQPHQVLVERAYHSLTQIFSTHLENAMLEAGEYIIKEFYGGDPERARNKDPVEKESLNQLIQRLQNRSSSAPSKSWIYNAVNLVVENEDLRGFHTYGKLLLSHKVLLLPIDSFEIKKQLIQETYDNNYTIEQLRNRIPEVWRKETKIKEQKSLTQLIKKPELLLSDEFSSAIEEESLSKLKLKTLDRLTTQAQHRVDQIEKTIEDLNSQAKRYKELISIVEEVRIKKSRKTPEKPKRSRFQDWVHKTVSCCNGCSNDCIYCFSKGDRVFQKKTLALEDWKKGEVRLHDVKKRYRHMEDPVMFPGTHDITPNNFEVCLKILDGLLKAGNRVFIVSKPRLQLIKKICEDLSSHKKNIIFRFTIGANSDDVLSFWEPGAPPYRERKESLKYAYDAGYRTSVSIEPMLDAEHIEELVSDISPFVNHSIWVGTMNHQWYFNADEKGAKTEKAKLRAKRIIDYLGQEKARQLIEESHKIEKGQSKDSLREVYEKLKDKKLQGKDEPLVKWKWHIRKALDLPLPEKPEEWPID